MHSLESHPSDVLLKDEGSCSTYPSVLKEESKLATKQEVDGPDAQQQEDKHIRVSSLRNRPLTAAQLAALMKATQ